MRPNSVPFSTLGVFHCPFPCGLFRGAALGQPPSSPGVDWIATPLAWPFVLLTAVDDEEMDELEEMEEDEFVLERAFRGIKTPLSSELTVELRDWLPLSPHADRLIFAKLGGLATAVMRSVGGHVWRARNRVKDEGGPEIKASQSRA